MTENIEARIERIVARIKDTRETYRRCLADVTAQVANNSSEWSIVDLLRHVNGAYYRNTITRLLEEDRPQLGGGGFDAEGFWRRTIDSTLANIDETLAI